MFDLLFVVLVNLWGVVGILWGALMLFAGVGIFVKAFEKLSEDK